MRFKQIIREAITRVVGDVAFVVEHPADERNGDYATSVALVVAKGEGKNPRDVAEEYEKSLIMDEELGKIVDRVEIAGPGFINFYLKKGLLQLEVLEILKTGDDYGKGRSFVGKRIMVEYTDPNPFKKFHIGHLMSNAIGESIARLYEFCGAEVKRACYQGDVGMHVAKAIWGMKQMGKEKWNESGAMDKMSELLGEAYVMGAKAFEENEQTREEIVQLNKVIYERSDEEISRLYDLGRKWSLESFESIYKILGTKFDYYFFESEMSKSGVELVKSNPQIFEESQGAIVFKGEEYGLHTRVFVNALGLPTYEAKELALARKKQEVYDYDLSVVVTANEINEYFKVLLKAMGLIYPDVAEKTRHLGHGMLKLTTGKMSSRTGEVITGEKLYSEVLEMVKAKMKEADNDIAKNIAVAAIKYPMLKQGIGRDVVYDPNEAVATDGNTGSYLQYVCVRAWGVQKQMWEKYGERDRDVKLNELKIGEREDAILGWIYRFGEVVEQAGETLQPHLVCDYLFELGQRFNSFYNADKIMGSESEDFRLLLSLAVAQVMKNGLRVLGMETVEKM